MDKEKMYYDEIRKFAEIELQICRNNANVISWYAEFIMMDFTMMTDIQALSQLIPSKTEAQAIITRMRMYYIKLVSMFGKEFMDTIEDRKVQAINRIYGTQADTISAELSILSDIKSYFMEKKAVEWFERGDKE